MKRILNLPIYVKLGFVFLIALSGLIVAFNWPTAKREFFTSLYKVKPLTVSEKINNLVQKEIARIDGDNKKVAAARTSAPAPVASKPKPVSAFKLYSGAHIKFGYLNVSPGDFISQIEASGGGVNMISPAWFTAKGDGSISDQGSMELVNYAHGKGISVVPFVNGGTGSMLQDPAIRSRLINEITNKIINYNVEGINVDFESPDITRDGLNAFMQELSNGMHSAGKISTIAVNARISDSQTWLNRYDYSFLGQYSDLVIIMAYDEHYRGSSPGPVASIGWFRQAGIYAARYIPREKIIMGMPFYGRHWINGSGGTGVSFSYIINSLLGPNHVAAAWHAEYGVPYAQYNDGSQHEIYFENGQSAQLKINEIRNFGFRGAAFWRLGQEDPGVWPVIKGF